MRNGWLTLWSRFLNHEYRCGQPAAGGRTPPGVQLVILASWTAGAALVSLAGRNRVWHGRQPPVSAPAASVSVTSIGISGTGPAAVAGSGVYDQCLVRAPPSVVKSHPVMSRA
jgi:hypothetical protein